MSSSIGACPRPGVRTDNPPGALDGASGSGKTTLLIRLDERYSPAVFVAEALLRVGLSAWLEALPDDLSTVLVAARQRCPRDSAGTSCWPACCSRRLHIELLTPGGLFPADRAVAVATHHLPRGVVCRTVDLAPGGVTSSA